MVTVLFSKTSSAGTVPVIAEAPKKVSEVLLYSPLHTVGSKPQIVLGVTLGDAVGALGDAVGDPLGVLACVSERRRGSISMRIWQTT